MFLLIVGLNFVLGSIWLMNNHYEAIGIGCFVAGMAATHYGWKQLHQKKDEDS